VYALPMRLAVAELPLVPFSIRHGHLAHPVRAVVVNWPIVHDPVLEFDAQGADGHALHELPLQSPTAPQ
jgi:hypothetical protein